MIFKIIQKVRFFTQNEKKAEIQKIFKRPYSRRDGSFIISNYRGMTTFAFRVPSQGVTDFITISEDDVLAKTPWWKFWK